MKKDKEWAFIELGKLFPSHAEMHDYPDNITVTKCELLNKVYDILKQLDEPETLSQEWIEGNSVYASSDGVTEEYVYVDELQNLLVPKQEITEEQVTEYLRGRNMTAVDSTLVHRESPDSKIVTEIPSIPEFIAEFLEGKEDYMLYELFDDEWLYEEHDQIAKWLYDNDDETNRKKELNLVLAHRHGYEVEVEQRYIVSDNSGLPLLIKTDKGEVMSYDSQIAYNNDNGTIELTEKEIKDYDERYFAFAKPVEEVEAH